MEICRTRPCRWPLAQPSSGANWALSLQPGIKSKRVKDFGSIDRKPSLSVLAHKDVVEWLIVKSLPEKRLRNTVYKTADGHYRSVAHDFRAGTSPDAQQPFPKRWSGVTIFQIKAEMGKELGMVDS